MREYYVYIMTSHSKTLYVGITNNLAHRVYQHKHKLISGFTSRYNLTRLAYYESTRDVDSAIAREKQIKGWLRKKKIALIESMNPLWEDLSLAWMADEPETLRSAQGDTGGGSQGDTKTTQAEAHV